SGTMTITALLLTLIFSLKKMIIKAGVALVLIFVNVVFLLSNLFKIPSGGYWSLFVALIPFILIVLYALGQRKLYKNLKFIPKATFIERFLILSEKIPHINGTALFLSKTTT